jgi:hypothetical protein
MHLSAVQRPRAGRVISIFAVGATLALAGCGSSVDETLVTESGVHGNQLERVYVLYSRDTFGDATNRDFKDINAALKAKDLKQATPGDLRRAQAELRSRIKRVEKAVTELRAANRKLKATPEPNFKDGLKDSFANSEFAKAYATTTDDVERYTASDLASAGLAFTALEKYLDFLEQWEEFVTNNDTAGLVTAGEGSDKALSRLKAAGKRVDQRGTLSSKIRPQVARMSTAASDSAELADLIGQLKEQYPKSFLAVHIVEKK